MVVVARSVLAGAAAEAMAGCALGRNADADAGRVLHDGSSVDMGGADLGGGGARRCWRATRSMRAAVPCQPCAAVWIWLA